MIKKFCENCFGTGLVDGAIYCGCEHGKALNKKVIEKFTGAETKVTGRRTIDIKKNGEIIESLEMVFPKKEDEPLFKDGDWVEIGNEYITGNPKVNGFVVSVSTFQKKALVQATWNSLGKNNNKGWIPFKHLTKLQQETDPNILIDLALATGDKEWFTQLTRGME